MLHSKLTEPCYTSEQSLVTHLVAPLLVFACTCASAESHDYRPAVRSLIEIRQQGVVMQQWDLSCGAAALATVLTYQYGDPVSEHEIARGMLRRTDPLRVKVRGGFSLLDLKRYVETRGYNGTGYTKLTLQDLQKFGPTLVPLKLNGYDHFVVFKGVSEGDVHIADPAFGNRRLTVPAFNRAWLGNIGFVVQRGDGAPAGHRMLVPRAGEAAGPDDRLVRSALR